MQANERTNWLTLRQLVSETERGRRPHAYGSLIFQAICTEAGLMALRERRMKVTNEDFLKAKETVLYRKQEKTPEGLYL